MKKLKLSLDALEVESFAAVGGAGEPGTVRGQEAPTIPPWCGNSDLVCWTQPTGICACTPRAGEV